MKDTAGKDIPISSLYPDMYGFQKSTVTKAFVDLEIKRFTKPGSKRAKFIRATDKLVLDEYMRRLKEQGRHAADEYARERRGVSEVERFTAEPAAIIATSSAQAYTPSAIVQMMGAIAAQKAGDTLAPQRQLQEAYIEEFLLTSSQIREIIGVKSWAGQPRLGYTFRKVGKDGRQSLWSIEKVISAKEAVIADLAAKPIK